MDMTRRGMLASLAAGGAMAAIGADVAAEKPLKFCVFADLHFLPGTWANCSVEFLDKILNRAKAANCDAVFQLGDFVQGVHTPAIRDFVKHYNEFSVPTYHVLGNHECDFTSFQDILEAYRLDKGYYKFDVKGWRFVVLNPHYWSDGGVLRPFERENYWKKIKPGAPCYCLPPEQFEWFEDAVVNSPYPCIILSHESMMRPPNDGLYDRDRLLAVVRKANAKRKGQVRLVACGHHHVSHFAIEDGIPFWEVNGANFYSNGFKHEHYPADFLKKHPCTRITLTRAEPLSAIVTIGPGGHLKIEGARADWIYGVGPEKIGAKAYDSSGRKASDAIPDIDITLA